MKPLTPKQRRFVSEYLKDLNATQAAIRCGYSKKTAQEQGSRLLSKRMVAEAVAKGTEKQLAKAELSASLVIEHIRRIAMVDVRGYYDAQGNLKPMHELTEEQGSALAGIETILKNAKAGDGIVDRVHKIKVFDKVRALELLGKHFSLLTNVHEVRGESLEELIAGSNKEPSR